MVSTTPRWPVWTALETIMRNAGDDTATLAKKAGLTQPCVWQVIYGTRRGSHRTIYQIARAYGMTWSELDATRPDASESGKRDTAVAS